MTTQPEHGEPLTEEELGSLLLILNGPDYKGMTVSLADFVGRPDAARELIELERDGPGDMPPIIIDEMARRGNGGRLRL